MALMVPVLLTQPERWMKWTAGIGGLLILLTQSAGAILALVAGLPWLVVAQPTKWRILGLVSFVGLLLAVAVTHLDATLQNSGRAHAWPYYWQMFVHKAITGWGPGTVMEASRGIPVGHPMVGWRHTHMELLQVACEQGLIGVLLVLWMVGETLNKAWAIRTDVLGAACGAGVVAVLANSLVNFPFHLTVVAIPCALMVMTCWILAEEAAWL